MRSNVTPQFGFSGPGGLFGGRWEPVVTQAERAEGRTEKRITVRDGCTPFGGN